MCIFTSKGICLKVKYALNNTIPLLKSTYLFYFLDGVRQFVIVTAIDEIGVPNNDMKNAYKYRIVQKICKKVSVAFDVDLFHVIPVSNYFQEVKSNPAKNAMSLFNLWRVFNSGKEYIERKLNKRDNYDDFRRLLMRRE